MAFAQRNDEERGERKFAPRRGGKGKRRKVCYFTVNKITHIHHHQDQYYMMFSQCFPTLTELECIYHPSSIIMELIVNYHS